MLRAVKAEADVRWGIEREDKAEDTDAVEVEEDRAERPLDRLAQEKAVRKRTSPPPAGKGKTHRVAQGTIQIISLPQVEEVQKSRAIGICH
jgi:hypothetical protein